MSYNKYELIMDEKGNLRPKALRNIYNLNDNLVAHEGAIGGIVTGKHNLSQDDSSWISYDSSVSSEVRIEDYALIKSSTLEGSILVGGNSVLENVEAQGKATIYNSKVTGENIYLQNDSSELIEIIDSKISGNVSIMGNVSILDNSSLTDRAYVNSRKLSDLSSNIVIKESHLKDSAVVKGNTHLKFTHISGNAQVLNCVIEPDIKLGQDKPCKLSGYMHVSSSFKQAIYFEPMLGAIAITALYVPNKGWRYSTGCEELLTASEFKCMIHSYDSEFKLNPHKKLYLRFIDFVEDTEVY